MVQENHVPNWEDVKVLAQETENTSRRIRESIWIRQKDNMNRDEGAYHLSHLYDDLLKPRRRGGEGPKTSYNKKLAKTTTRPTASSSTVTLM